MNVVRVVLRFGLPLVVVLLGGMTMRKLIKSKPEAKKVAPADRGALVEVETAEATRATVRVEAQGTVMPARSLELRVQVGGKVVSQSDALVPGGRIPANTEIVRIERRDYDLAVREASARVATAEQTRDLELGRRSVAEREWALMGGASGDDAAKRRALRGPQKASAEASVRAAEAVVATARLAAARTRISTPFNALVLDESVEVGQVVQPGVRLGRLVGTDAFWVQVSVPVADLDWLQVPGAKATVTHRSGERMVRREGVVVRMLGDLDPLGTMARLVVEVPDPLGLENSEKPLLLGAFVEVSLSGRAIDGVYELPRTALREGERVWRVAADDTLVSGPVKIARRLRNTVLVSEGLSNGDRVVVSRLASPVPGMQLRVKQPASEPTAEAPK